MRPRHVALLLVLAAIWGSSYLLIKYALEDFSAPMVVFVRTAVAAVVLLAVILVSGGEARAAVGDARRRPGTALLLGATAIAVPFMLITIGEHEVPSGLTAVLISPASLFVAILAPALDRTEAIDRRQAVGLLVGLVGVALLVGVETVDTAAQFLAAVAILGAAFSYAVSSYVVKGGYKGFPSLASSAISVTAGTLLVLPFALATLPDEAPGTRAVLSLLALGVIHTAVAFVLFYVLIAEIGAGRASLVSYLAPGVALFYGALLLDEEITLAAIGGLAMILAGVALASRRPSAAPEGADVIEVCEEELAQQRGRPVVEGFRP